MNRPHKYQLLAAAGLFGAVLGGLLIEGTGPGPAPGRAFRMTLSNEPPTLDWTLATDSVSITVLNNLMEGLTEYDGQLRPRPAIANSWEVSSDGRVYRFHLREDALWSDGVRVTAADFEYSWKRLLDPETGAEYAYFLYDLEGAEDYNSGRLKDPSAVGVRALDDSTLEVRLRKPIVFFPSIATFVVTFPLRRDVVEKYGDRWTEPSHIVTNGPFLLSEWRHEYKLTLIPNPRYYGPPPGMNRVTLFVINETTTALTLYETGDLELTPLPPEAIETFRGRPDYVSTPLLRGNYYGFNLKKAPFHDPRVRQAFSLAIDRRDLPRILKRGEIPSAYWIPPGMPYHNPDIGLSFDPDRARRLLSEAGYPKGRGFPEVTAVFNTGPDNSLVAEFLQAQWKQHLGIAIGLDNQEWKVYLKRLQNDTPPLFRLGWGADYPDPDTFMNLFTSTSGMNRTHWGNSDYDRLVSEAALERDPASRREKYDEAQRILLETDSVIIPLFVSTQSWAVRPGVEGLQFNALEMIYLKKVHWANP
ncbi:MAG TPA: peptide ABC transporter substrate-binding protein [Nitrospiria bacterium]